MKRNLFKIFAVLMVLAMLVSPASAQQPVPNRGELVGREVDVDVELVKSIDLSDAIRTKDGKVGVIVLLKNEPLATYQGGVENLRATMPAIAGTEKLDVNSNDSKLYLDYLELVQKDFTVELAEVAPSAKVEHSFKVAMNALSLKIDEKEISALQKMDQVVQVYPDQIREVQMDASLDLINAPVIWEALGGRDLAGDGVKIAVVDTGLRFDNPMFSNPGDVFEMPFGYPRGYCLDNPSDPDVFCNGKVISARYFYDPALAIYVDEVMSPLDINGHGSHTAGTSGGNKVVVAEGDLVPADTEISGVAPGAYLMIYKGLFENAAGDNGTGTDTMLSAALEAALMDGADVINNSWGGGAGGDPNASVYKPLIDSITAAGTLVVFSAGNSGPGSNTIGCPGCVESTLAVAASSTDRIVANNVSITAPTPVPTELTNIAGMQGSGPVLVSDLAGPIKFSESNPLGCNPGFTAGTFTGAIALISRGTCNFSEKVNNAVAAGAIGVIVYNNAGGPPSAMGALELTTVSSLMVSMADGLALRDYIIANPTSTTVLLDSDLTFIMNPDWEDVLAGFSSVGPNGDPNVLKPDITAPGVNILSAFSPAMTGGTDPLYAFLGGTSMAAPHVTGAAALIRQLYPDLSPAEIKTLLTSTADPTVLKPDGLTPANAFNMGSGRLDLETAMSGGLVFSKPSFTNGTCVLNCGWTNTIKNFGDTETTWTATVTTDPGLDIVVLPDSVTLGANYQTSFNVQADVSTLTPGTWYFATITWTDDSGMYSPATLQVVVRPAASTNPLVLSKSVDKASAKPDEVLSYTLNLSNFNTEETTFFLRDPLPTNLTYVPDSVSTNASYNVIDNQIEAQITLDGTVAVVEPYNWGGFFDLTPYKVPGYYLELDDYCGLSCDDYAINLTGMGLYYFGTYYDKIGISTNGFLQPGGATSATASTQFLPNSAAPNNVIAPLWTDLNLDAGGDWFYVPLYDGTYYYDVFQWTDVPQWGTSQLYTFQIWFVYGTDMIFFSYESFPAGVATYNTTIGIEDPTGLVGDTFYNVTGGVVTGSLPNLASTTPDLVVSTVLDSETVTFQAVVDITDMNVENVVNIVEIVDSNKNVLDRAYAITNIIYYKYLFPIIAK
ncbi:MAG: S8 family serine peptidase [Anaerolineaceae bacterium]|nr:S8 family serine peptidase [Anaerolineaceae bacterium]